MEILAIVAAVLFAIAAASVAIWLVPRRQIEWWRRAGIANEEKLAELGVQTRSSIIQALGGLALIATLAITAYQVSETRRSAERAQRTADANVRLAEEGQVSERFSRAIDQLGSGAVEVRTGALFALMRLGLTSAPHSESAFVTAATFVRRRYQKPERFPKNGCEADFTRVPDDIKAALRFVLPQLAPKLSAGMRRRWRVPGLRGTGLDGLAIDGLELRRFDLTGIKFRYASLQNADFRRSNLSYAHFEHACLRFANFQDAVLVGANFEGALLTRARFTRKALVQAALSDAQRRELGQ